MGLKQEFLTELSPLPKVSQHLSRRMTQLITNSDVSFRLQLPNWVYFQEIFFFFPPK